MKNPTIIAGLSLSLLCLNFKDMTKINEIWLAIPGYEGLYEISNSLIVKSTGKLGQGNSRDGRIIYPQKNGRGYLYVSLSKNKQRINNYMHRLIATIFIQNPLSKPLVNHKNGIKDDNRIENLEWCTLSENMIHAYKNNLIPKGQDHYISKLTNSDVLEIRQSYSNGESRNDLSNRFNISKSSLHRIIRRKNWAHL